MPLYPLDEIWLTAAARVGLRPAAGTPARQLFQDICGALLDGAAGPARARLEAALAGPHGLRRVLAPDAADLPDDPLTPAGDPEVVAARIGLSRAQRPPFAPHLAGALEATAQVLRAAADFVLSHPLYAEGSLLALVAAPAPRHPLGFPQRGRGVCGECAWRHTAGPGKPVDRCRQAAGARLDPSWPACERFEPALDCQECGACCRAAYHSVTVSSRDPVRQRHPDLVVDRTTYLELARSGDRCAALDGGRAPGERYGCRIYEDRPRTCREFERGGPHCLEARRRVGLSV